MASLEGSIPAPILEADEALHELYRRVHFSRFLNPINAPEARRSFLAGAQVPAFEYQPATWADDELRLLDRLGPPDDHPLGRLLSDAISGTRCFIVALRDRTADSFDALAHHADWYPDRATLSAARSETRDHDLTAYTLQAGPVAAALQEALQQRGLDGWGVEMDPVMSARVLVDGAKRLIKVSPRARFRERDVDRLIAHEVEVHAWRSANGRRQPLRIFSTGLPGSLETEEGLAMVAEELASASSPGSAWRQSVVVRAIDLGRRLGFRELHREITGLGGPGLAWGVCLRLKRGLADPGEPGVYAKDIVYYRGMRRVKAWLQASNDVAHLYVGKVGIDDPVADWIRDGWLTPQPVPPLFSSRAVA